MTARCRVGCAGFGRLKRERYFTRFDLVEIRETFFDPPGRKTLARWRREAPEGFAFVPRAWQTITHPASSPGYGRIRRDWDRGAAGRYGSFLPTEEVRRAWEIVREAAEILDAPAILFSTPPSFTPTAENLENMAAFFASIEREGRAMVWDPGGVWREEEVAAVCRESNLVPALDPLLSPLDPDALFYFRLRTKVRGREHYTEDDFHWIGEKLDRDGRDSPGEGFVVWDTQDPARDATAFARWISGR